MLTRSMSDHDEPLLRTIYRCCYLSIVGQFLLLLGLVGLVVWTYFCTHQRWESAYWQHIEPVIREGLRGFSVGLDPKGEYYEVLQNGLPLNAASPSGKMMFGLESAGAVKGVLNRFADATKASREALDQQASDFWGMVQPRDDALSAIRLASFGVAESGAELRVPNRALAPLRDLQGLRLARAAAALFTPLPAFDLRLSSTAKVTGGAGHEAAELVRAAVADAQTYVDRDFSGDYRELDERRERDLLRAYFQAWCNLGLPALRQAPCQPPPAGTPASPDSLRLINDRLEQSLLKVARIESGSLWLAGKYRWLEIVFWVWFGVFTQSLVQHGLALTGGRRLEVWQPREFFRTVSKLFYAPALGVAVFFLRDYFSAEQESLDFAYNTPATLGLAFLLGMFPTTAYRLLRQLANTIFRGDISGSDKTKSIPRTVTVRVNASHRQPGELYRLETLRTNVADLYSAPLRN